MNSTNGEESYAADYSQTHAEDTNSEVFYQLIQANITEVSSPIFTVHSFYMN